MKKIRLIAIAAIFCCIAGMAKADLVVDSLERVIVRPNYIAADGSSLLEFQLWYMRQSLGGGIQTTPFRTYFDNEAVWYQWGADGVLNNKTMSISTTGNVRMGNLSPTTSYNYPASVLTLYNTSNTGLYIEQQSANTAIMVNASNANAYIIKGFVPQSSTAQAIWPTFSVKADGTVYSANSQLTLSDESHKSNIQTVANALTALREVNPVSYVLNTGSNENAEIATASATAEATATTTEQPTDADVVELVDPAVQAAIDAERDRPKYGFVAQQIAEVFPNVVYTLPTGEKAIAYQEIIPILVSAIQEQQSQIDSLMTEVAAINTPAAPRQSAPAALQEAIDEGSAALLQNTPNPFNQATEIGYRMPSGTTTAMIMVCDMSGKMLQSYPLSVTATSGKLTLQAGSYAPGMYLYTLLLDGVQIDTKQMIIYK